MLLHRSFATGFCMACCLGVLWQLRTLPLAEPSRPAEPRAEAPAAASVAEREAPCALRSPAVNVVDVAASAATPELVAQLIRVDDDERITAIDDRQVPSDLAAGAWLAARFQRETTDLAAPLVSPRGPLARGDYIDVTIEGGACSRRVLVLFH
jgi:hypothetical protein